MSDRLAEIEARLDEATLGPWERGDVWSWAGVLPERYGDDRCAYCAEMGEPVWVGRALINGKRMLAHKHRDPDPYGTDHIISAPDDLVCGNFDYEDGGVVHVDDAELIANAPTDLRDLLAVAKAAQEFIEEYRAMNGGEEPGDGPTRRLAWALANLEGGA